MINSKIFRHDIFPIEEVLMFTRNGTMERRRHDSVGSSTSTSGDERSGLSLASLKRASLRRHKILQFFDNCKQSERLLRESNVLQIEDGQTWDWEIIIAILSVCVHFNYIFQFY